MEREKLEKVGGVTLLELLVAVAITVIVGASIIGALYSGRSAWEAGQNIIVRHQNTRAAIDFISRDLQQAVVFSDGAEYIAGFRSDEYDAGFPFDVPYLVFTAMAGDPSSGFELSWVAYRLHEVDEVIWLQRARADYDVFGRTPATVADPIADIAWEFEGLSPDISNLSFIFHDSGGGGSSWSFDNTTPRLPERVEIEITAEGTDDPVTTSVRMPLAGLEFYVP